MPKNKIDEEELRLFVEAMKDVKPLIHDKIPPTHQNRHPSRKQNEPKIARFYFEDDPLLLPVSQDEFISFKKPEISDNLLRKLKKGQYNVQSVIDLHGLTVREAEIELSHYFTECQLHSIKVVLLIHGKGKGVAPPILKNKLNQWLRHYQNVLAFCTALPKHGGTGGMYVLLKRVKPSQNSKKEIDF